jgi:hypothetical protein
MFGVAETAGRAAARENAWFSSGFSQGEDIKSGKA